MNTRRQFLTNLLAAAGIPLVARASYSLPKPTKKQAIPCIMLPDGGPQPYKGPAIKVPSNRYWIEDRGDICRNGYHPGTNAFYRYFGDWDGTFKLEEGCTNPAYILADLTERLGIDHDFAIHRGRGPLVNECGWIRSPLNWQMLYDWGRHCDEPLDDPDVLDGKITRSIRMIASTENCHTHADLVALRQTLRMYCLQWQATDPRYGTSWPGVPYPKPTI